MVATGSGMCVKQISAMLTWVVVATITTMVIQWVTRRNDLLFVWHSSVPIVLDGLQSLHKFVILYAAMLVV